MLAKSEATRQAPVALGFRTHSGWATMVIVADVRDARRTPEFPQVVDRRRIELADPAIPRPVQPYHQAERLDLEAAERLIRSAMDEAEAMARQALIAASNDLKAGGYQVIACALLLGSGRPLPSLADILGSHPLIHTAEGELYRGAIARAGESLGPPITGVRERDLLDGAASELRLSTGDIERRIAEAGKALGPPWRQDEKYAMLAACIALARHRLRP